MDFSGYPNHYWVSLTIHKYQQANYTQLQLNKYARSDDTLAYGKKQDDAFFFAEVKAHANVTCQQDKRGVR